MGLSIVFMGTPKFAIPAMEAIHSEYGIKAVVTAADKPKGRGHKLLPSEVKERAIELDIPVLQPISLKDESFIAELKALEPDIIVVVAFRILPKEVYTLAKLACFNIHGSLLPKYRGAAPINWVIINGDQVTGLTSFLLKEKVDTGDLLLQMLTPIPDGSTAGDLHDVLSPMSAKLALDTCKLLQSNNFKAIAQSDSEASPAPKIFTNNAKIDFAQNALIVRNFIHGFSPVPGAWTKWNGKTLKILRADYSNCECEAKAMEFGSLINAGEFWISKDKFAIKCQHGYIFIKELQLEGKKAMLAIDFLRGYKGENTGKFEFEGK